MFLTVLLPILGAIAVAAAPISDADSADDVLQVLIAFKVFLFDVHSHNLGIVCPKGKRIMLSS